MMNAARHLSKKRSPLASLVFCGPLLVVGCTRSDSIGSGGDRDDGSGGSGGGTGGSTWKASDASIGDGLGGNTAQPDANLLCETLTCFSACQGQIASAPIDQPMGFVPVPSPSYAYETFPLGSDMVLATGRSFSEIRKWSDLSLLGSVPLPGTWGYESTAVVGNTAFVRDGHWNLAVLDLTDPTAPRATAWWPAAGSPVGSWRGKLVLSTGHGVSFLDVSNPLAPLESFCLPGIGAEFISGDTLVSSAAKVYRLDPALNTAALWASMPLGDTRLYAMEGMRLVIPATGGNGWNVGLYDLGGAAPLEVARHEQLYHPYLWSNSGFFFEAESTDLSRTIAYDMRGAFEPYSVSTIAGSECLMRLDALDGSAAFVISYWLPGARFSPDSPPPVRCPVEDPVGDARGVAALSPDGHTLLLPGGKGVGVFRDVDTGMDATDKEATVGIPDFLAWIGDRILAVDKTLAVEFQSSSATIFDAGNPQGAPAKVGLDPYTNWLGVSGGQMIGFTSAPGYQSSSSPTLALLDPNAATLVSKPIGLPTNASNLGYLWNDKLVAFDSGKAIVFNLDGSEQGRIALPSFIVAKTFLLANLGWFATTEAGEILRFDPASGTVEVGVTSCVRCALLGADSERVYALGPLAPPPGSVWEATRNYLDLTYTELRAYTVTKGKYPLVGRYPLTESSTGWKLLIGSKLALVADGALILSAPP